MVNAQLLAKQRGIKIAENKEATSPDYTNRITVKVYTSKTVHTVAGTLFRKDDERVVEIDGYYFEVVPHGNLLVAPHEDRPGIIGKVGTVLGEAGINIAFMQVGRRDQGGTAIMVMTVDNPIDDATLAKVAAVPGILDARVVKL